MIQHENDHLDGVLFFDRMTSFETLTFMDEFRRYWAKDDDEMTRRCDEPFTEAEAAALAPYFTNLDRPVFALVNLPETVKGALFARYSRSAKPLRRLFLDEFLDRGRAAGAAAASAVGVERAERLYQRVFNEYGDDSVAQLGGVHLAVEDASNILTKVLERGRLMAYLEQSTRYIPYTERRGDALALSRASRARRPSAARASTSRRSNAAFEIYARWIDPMRAWFERASSEGRRRLRRGLPVGDPRQGARHAARHAAGGDAVERRHLRHRTGLRGR